VSAKATGSGMPVVSRIIRRIPSVFDKPATFGRMRRPTSGTFLGHPKHPEAPSSTGKRRR